MVSINYCKSLQISWIKFIENFEIELMWGFINIYLLDIKFDVIFIKKNFNLCNRVPVEKLIQMTVSRRWNLIEKINHSIEFDFKPVGWKWSTWNFIHKWPKFKCYVEFMNVTQKFTRQPGWLKKLFQLKKFGAEWENCDDDSEEQKLQ